MYNSKDPKSLEKYSSAITLSDMEIFLFPELLYALVLANIMSPILWEWKKHPWFANMGKMKEYRRLLRTKQFIMDNFVFNLDLDTWGLTTKDTELARFSDFVDESTLSKSNALFGYEGDKYYFDIDIRRHFGLDKYTSDVIPYWKTETLEAMEAFKHKEGYPTGAGECVSLSTLYAAALFVVGGIPLEKIHLLATPLHSQNFIDVKGGVLTNNRRIVTKNMWFNGTELSAKARRALENERVTMVVNNHGYIHTLYEEATLPQSEYEQFSQKLKNYLKVDITYEILASFLRHNSHAQKCFQVMHSCCGKPRYIEIERVFQYEHSSKSKIGDSTQTNLLHEIDEDEYYTSPIQNRVILNELEHFFKSNELSIDNTDSIDKLRILMRHTCYEVNQFVSELLLFCRTEPTLPSTTKRWISQSPIDLSPFTERIEIIEYLESIRKNHPIADLAFSAYRDLARSPWKPFLKAAFERNPVCIHAAKKREIDEIYQELLTWDNQSIYNGTRLAQPDEVWNYTRGDGFEKAITLLSIIKSRTPKEFVSIQRKKYTLIVQAGEKRYSFTTAKEIPLPTTEDFKIIQH